MRREGEEKTKKTTMYHEDGEEDIKNERAGERTWCVGPTLPPLERTDAVVLQIV